MTKMTEQVIINATALDRSIDPALVEQAIAVLRGERKAKPQTKREERKERIASGLDDAITATEAKELLGVSTTATLRNYLKRGYIRTIGRGRAGVLTRYSRKSIEEFLKPDEGFVRNPDYDSRMEVLRANRRRTKAEMSKAKEKGNK